MSGKPHNTFHGIHTKYRPALNTDHPLLNSHKNGSADLEYYAKEQIPIPTRRAMSVEPGQSNTMDRKKRDASGNRRRRSGDRGKRGVSVDRQHRDVSSDRRADVTTDRTVSEINLRRRELSQERRRDISVDRSQYDSVSTTASRREPSCDRSTNTISAMATRRPSVDTDSSSDSDEAGNYVTLTMQPGQQPPNLQASRQMSSESCNSVFERNTTLRNSNTSHGRPSLVPSPGFTKINYSDAHYPAAKHFTQQGHQSHHHHNAHRNASPHNTSEDGNTYVNVHWLQPERDDETPPPRPPRPTNLDIHMGRNSTSSSPSVPPKTQPRVSRTPVSTPQSGDDIMRSRFSPGGSPPPMMHAKTLLPIDVDGKPSLPPKPGASLSTQYSHNASHMKSSEFL